MTIQQKLQAIDTLLQPLRDLSDSWAAPILNLSIRVYMAKVFFASGIIKLEKWINEGFDAVKVGFEEHYPIPGLSADIAAPMATAAELILPILLVLGLFGRFAAAGLLLMTMAIQYLIPEEYDIQNTQHYYWMFLLSVIILYGAGKFSADRLVLKWVRR